MAVNKEEFRLQQDEFMGGPASYSEAGRVILCKGGSKSSSSNTTSTQNTDRRMAVDSGVGISSDTSTVTINSNDLSADIVNKALDTIKADDATNGAGFAALLSLADKMFTGAGEIIGNAQETTLQQVGALTSMANDQRGSIDQKTLIIIAGAAVAVSMLKAKK